MLGGAQTAVANIEHPGAIAFKRDEDCDELVKATRRHGAAAATSAICGRSGVAAAPRLLPPIFAVASGIARDSSAISIFSGRVGVFFHLRPAKF